MAWRRLLALAALPAAGALELDLGNWMGQLAPILGQATLLDLSLPGAHDAMTYDLSNTIAEGYEGMGAAISKILHSVTPLIAGKFIREQGQTQGLKLTQMLDGGIRFIDFRIIYSQPPDSITGKKDWFNLHGCESNNPAMSYLKEVRTWLDAHPKEIVVFWVSRHGDMQLNGTDQYPDTTPADRQKFFAAVTETFKGLMFDASAGRLNETSIEDLWSRGQRVVWYTGDFVQSTGASKLAMDGTWVDNNLPDAGWHNGALGEFRNGGPKREGLKAKNRFYLASMAHGGGTCQIKWAAVINFVPLAKELGAEEKCKKCFDIPDFGYCPMSLQEQGQLANYYNQRVIEAIYKEGATNPAADFPNAIYIDGIDSEGTIRTGTQRLNPLSGESLGSEASAHEADSYGYAATLIGASVRRLCRGAAAAKASCDSLMAGVEEARARHPVSLWDDTTHGRQSNWPTLPPPTPTPEQVLV